MEEVIATRHLQGASELTLVAPIRQGLINTLDTRTYATRLRAVLRTLHMLRQTSREYSMVRPFSDSTDRIRTITDLRMAIHEPEQKLLLAVTFDRPWEPYLRIIWREVGTLLDVIFCNCAGYPISHESTFAEYGRWIRDARTNTQFLYRPSAQTFDDIQYLGEAERILRETVAPELEAAKLHVVDPAETAKKTAAAHAGYTVRQGMQALAILYRLADVYPPQTPDGEILLRAARELLRELLPVLGGMPPAVQQIVEQRFGAQLKWIRSAATPRPVGPAVREPADTDTVQGGILNKYAAVTHGCVLLLSVDDPASAADFVQALRADLYTEGDARAGKAPPQGVYLNVAFTAEGLRALGLGHADMAAFPAEFTQGMEERAGLIGDLRGNHPRNWALPARNWPVAGGTAPPDGLVQLSTVHIVVQMRTQSADPDHALIAPLRTRIETLMRAHPKVRLLSVQAMRRYVDPKFDNPREHFGFIDGISQPEIGVRPMGGAWSNIVGRGELLLGYRNDRGDDPVPDAMRDNGSFLVIRKLRQDVAALNDAIHGSGIAADVLKARMMGRTTDGDPLVKPGADNAFDYSADKDGSLCPFAAHIRRANPRTGDENADHTPTVPRIMRRGMSYGPRFEDQPEAERGLMFMCYNASIAEQFEVIQRWIAGGNSSGALSGHGDPLLGVPQVDAARTFRYHDGTSVTRVTLDAASDKPQRPFVRLEWGMYLFAPSSKALELLERKARACKPPIYARPVNMPPKGVDEGERIIRDLLQRESLAATHAERSDLWKAVLEDGQARSYGDSEAVWAAIRANHGGVLKTSYGVLVGNKSLVMQVLDNRKDEYTVDGYNPRLKAATGEMYLGLDDKGPGCPYRNQSTTTNATIQTVSEAQAFDLARRHAGAFLAGLVQVAKGLAGGDSSWDLSFDIKEVSDHTLARLCETWFSLKNDGMPFRAGGSPWSWQPGEPPFYPGHFTAPSRYVFQPNPGAASRDLGEQRGTALLTAMRTFVSAQRAGSAPTGAIAGPVFAAFPNDAAGNDLLARTLLGTLIGFLPTVEGNFRATLNEWLDEKTFWNLQNAYLSDAGADSWAKAQNVLRTPLMRTMQFRPAPEIGWRRAVKKHVLGGVKVHPGDTIVIGTVSATQEDLENGVTDVAAIFGGARHGAMHPTHACPGYQIGMGSLLGMIAALMEIGPLRPTPAPLTVALSGTLP